MKITLYTITDCEFSKQEKDYLTSHQLQYEEKNLETNKEFLTEMLAVSNNFAGTPVTKIEKDDGKIEVLKGFTKEEFDKTLGFAEEKKLVDQKAPDEVKTEPVAPSTGTPPQVQQTQSPAPQPVTPPAANDLSADSSSVDLSKEEASAKADPLNSILADLQSKSVAANPNPQAPPAPEQPAENIPNVPDFPAKT